MQPETTQFVFDKVIEHPDENDAQQIEFKEVLIDKYASESSISKVKIIARQVIEDRPLRAAGQIRFILGEAQVNANMQN